MHCVHIEMFMSRSGHSCCRTIIHTDEWRAYRRLAALYVHNTVNHSINFVNPVTGKNTCTFTANTRFHLDTRLRFSDSGKYIISYFRSAYKPC